MIYASPGIARPEEEVRLLGTLLFAELPQSDWPEPRLRRLLGRSGLQRLLERAGEAQLSGAERLRLEAAAEVARRCQPRPPRGSVPVTSPAGALAYLADLRCAPRELMYALLLDTRNRVLRRELVAAGGLNSASVDPRDLFGPALRAGAAALVLAHNHPSGDPAASSSDVDATRRLGEAGRLLGVELLDHLVVAARGYVSLREAGLM